MATSSMHLFHGSSDYILFSVTDYQRFFSYGANVRCCAYFHVYPHRFACVCRVAECTTCRVRPISVREGQSRPMGFRDVNPFTDVENRVSSVVPFTPEIGTLNWWVVCTSLSLSSSPIF